MVSASTADTVAALTFNPEERIREMRFVKVKFGTMSSSFSPKPCLLVAHAASSRYPDSRRRTKEMMQGESSTEVMSGFESGMLLTVDYADAVLPGSQFRLGNATSQVNDVTCGTSST